jgi:RNA polymerase sigma-70 factor (ECF subfamily)
MDLETQERQEYDNLTIYSELAPTVRKLLRQYGTDPEMREDLAGEIYCMFRFHLDRFDSRRGVPLLPYLATQIATSVHTYARRNWRTSSREITFDGLKTDAYSGLSKDPTPEWHEKLIREELVAALPEALARLSKRQRTVVLWRLIEERTFEDIAEQLQIATTTARSQLRHGLNNLRSQIGDGQSDVPEAPAN